MLADVFALYVKTKNFPWHMSGPHFRDYHLLLDDQADQILAMTDVIAERSERSALQRDTGLCASYQPPVPAKKKLCNPNWQARWRP
jgi:hypothetical protein